MEEIRATIAHSIGQARRRRGLSQAALADAIGQRTGKALDPSQVSDWETGKNLPRIDILVAVAASLGVSLDQLVTGEDTLVQQLIKTVVAEVRGEYGRQLRDLERRVDELGGKKPPSRR